MNEENIVENWLKSLHLGRYAQSFIDNGYDDLEICKQIGEPDLDAIGVSDATHRQQILRAVRVLLEHGGTAVYFTLEENARHGLDPTDSIKEALVKEKEAIRAAHSPAKKYVDEYEEGKAEFVRFPKMQLKMIIRDKLVRDGIRLSTQPYTNPVSNAKIYSSTQNTLSFLLSLLFYYCSLTPRLAKRFLLVHPAKPT
ncbi:sterile alpha motif domain-containing protein 5-like [Centruroides sculpturatus]|uniref:sterile alpha motif domain-containing protein 5-like n=1 Tax=Centruroides sculpturatus TaxID=218467 RepID=UPI000C6CA331|nr:sterile alpha motif domain-containing protein 5-like [Centruroides sculpturatus]